LRADTLLKLLEALDAFRRPLQLTQFLLACEADARGRTGFEERPYPQADRVRAAFAAASAIDIPALLQGSGGAPVSDPATIKRRIASARIEAIAATGEPDA
jgi:tRNA nucleotidyltransferase (CCA-adding enzyme)